MTNEEALQAALFIGDRMCNAILGLGCSATPPFSNDEMGEAGKEAWEWRQFMEQLYPGSTEPPEPTGIGFGYVSPSSSSKESP